MGRQFSLILLTFCTGIGQVHGNVCESLIRQHEVSHGIPDKLLTAISLVESGRKINGSTVAWPWTINANGKPYVFATKHAAIAKVRQLRRAGITSIDVGCMQVNLKHHPKAFKNLTDAFDPATNIAYAAKFLKSKKVHMGSWVNAIAHYHSSTAKFHLPYKAKVLKTWATVQKGRLTFGVPVMVPTTTEGAPVDQFLTEVERHRGEFIDTVVTPSGRKVAMVVRFAPYKGFARGNHGGNPGGQQRDQQALRQVSLKKSSESGPKIIRVHNSPKTLNSSSQNHVVIQTIEAPYKIIRVNGLNKQIVSNTAHKGAVIAKFRAKPR